MEERIENNTNADSEIERFVSHSMDFLVQSVIKIEEINNQKFRRRLSNEKGMLLDLQYAIEISFNVAKETALRIGLGSEDIAIKKMFLSLQ